jgi:hypothetical protein
LSQKDAENYNQPFATFCLFFDFLATGDEVRSEKLDKSGKNGLSESSFVKSLVLAVKKSLTTQLRPENFCP